MRGSYLAALCCCAWSTAIPAWGAETLLDFQYGEADLTRPEALSVSGVPGRLSAVGGPALPMEVRTCHLPFGTRVLGMEILGMEEVGSELAEPVPIVPGRFMISSGRLVTMEDPPVLLGADGWYPESPVRLEVRGGLAPDGLEPITQVLIRVFPIRTRPGSTRVKLLRSLTIRLRTEPPEPQHRDDPYGMIIIAPEEFLTTLQPFIAARQAGGMAVQVATVEEIQAVGWGRDLAEGIKGAIADRVESSGARFVLLAGDADVIPVRYTFHRVLGMMTEWKNTPSDLYFADLYHGDGSFCDWDADGDDRFGEASEPGSHNPDRLDLLPDVLLGRIPASTPEELSAYLDKILVYESSVTGSEPWVQRTVLAGADTFGPANGEVSGIPEGEYACESIAGHYPPGADLTRLYETDVYLRDAELTTQSLSAAVNLGCGSLCFANHGYTDGWYWGGSFQMSDVDALTNGGMLPQVFGYACITASFDDENPEHPDFGYYDRCLAESWVLKPDGGAMGYIGATRSAFAGGWAEGSISACMGYINQAFYRALTSGYNVQGMTLLRAQWEFLVEVGIHDPHDLITILECVLMGDPALAVGGGPNTPLLTVAALEVEDSIGGDGDGCAEPGETVQISLHLANHGAGSSNVSGGTQTTDPDLIITQPVVEFGALGRGESGPPAFPLEIQIAPAAPIGRTASVFCYLTAEGFPGTFSTSFVLPIGDGPALSLRSLRVTQESNHDRHPGPKETVNFSPVVANHGCVDGTGLSLEVSTTDPYILELDCPSTFPDVPVGTTVFGYNLCSMKLDSMVPHGHVMEFEVRLGDGRTEWIETASLTVIDRVLPEVDQLQVSPNPPVPGETATLTALVRDGSGVAEVRAIVEAPDGVALAELALLDDGQHGDGAAGDGIFGGMLEVPVPGRFYTVDLFTADGGGYSGIREDLMAWDTRPFRSSRSVLLVSDSLLDREVGLVAAALDSGGIGYDLWSWFRGTPSADILAGYREGAVIWYCAHHRPLLTDEDRAVLGSYLDSGGNLLITEQDLGYDLVERGSAEEQDWYAQYLHAQYVQDGSEIEEVEGIPGDPISHGLSFTLNGGSCAWNQSYPSVVLPIPPARGILTYPGLVGGGFAGIAAEHAAGRVVYLAFGMEGIAQRDDREALMSGVLGSFGVASDTVPDRPPTGSTPAWWTTAELPYGEYNNRAIFYPGDGMIYITPGRDGEGRTNFLRRFDPDTGRVVETEVEIPNHVVCPALALLEGPEGKTIYLIGGYDEENASRPEVFRFTPEIGAFTRLDRDDWPAPREFCGCAVVGNRAYLFGGHRRTTREDLHDTWIFDPMASPGSRWAECHEAPLPNPRFEIVSGALDGRIYALGGVTLEGGGLAPVCDCGFLDPLQLELGWQPMAELPGSEMSLGCLFSLPTGSNVELAGSLLLAGRSDFWSAPDRSTWIYDPGVDEWSPGWPVSFPRIRTYHALTRGARGFDAWLFGGRIENLDESWQHAEHRPIGATRDESWCGIWSDQDSYRSRETMELNLALAEGESPEPLDLYVVLEVADSYFFLVADPSYPSFTEEAAPLATDARLPAGFEFAGPILQIPLPEESPTIELTWYATTVGTGSARLLGGLSWQHVRIEGG